MLRVTTLYAGSSAATAKYYTKYLTQAPGEQPGVWSGTQAAGLGLSGEVSTDALEALLTGCDPLDDGHSRSTAVNDDGDLPVTDLSGTSTVTLPAGYAMEHVWLGYAATEYGTQSATETASITLAGPATTGRGLYVAMTRGRDDNRVYVVTDTHDMSEARDVLAGIVASDRADIPAVVQRRQLAQQDRQPRRPQPRCQIPDWFHDLRATTADNYRQARQALDDSTAARGRLVGVVDTAARRIKDANTMCAPFEAELDAAHDAVNTGESRGGRHHPARDRRPRTRQRHPPTRRRHPSVGRTARRRAHPASRATAQNNRNRDRDRPLEGRNIYRCVRYRTDTMSAWP